MGLRNAFEEVATERTLRLVLAATNYARDINDRMRVIVDGGTITAGNLYMNGSTSTGLYRPWNDVNAVYTVDQREMQRLDSLQAGMQARQKWSYS